jgi:exodeoxyribonuclease V gamma subunit
VVATHASLRGVPFHTRFLMGMGEGLFPRAAVGNPMDLTTFKRKPGDLGQTEQDRYLFLESLMSARQALVLSYVGRDPLTREELQPSSLILDLRDLLLPALGAGGWDALTLRHPHHRHDLAYFPQLGGGTPALPPNHAPAARVEAEALLLGNSLRRAAGVVELPADRDRWNLDPQARTALAAWSGPLEAPPALAAPPDRLRITLSKLRKWLECQIQGGAILRLGLREEDGEDSADLAGEPIEADRLDLGALRKLALWEAVGRGLDAGTAVDRLHQVQVEAARMPAGVLFKGSRAGLVRTVDGWKRLLPAGAAPVLHRFGGDPSNRIQPLPVVVHEPLALELRLDGRQVFVQVEGSTEPQLAGWSLLPSRNAPPTAKRAMAADDRLRLLRAWMDHVLLAAAGLGPHHGGLVLGAPADARTHGAWTSAAPALTQPEARAQLAEWVAAAFTERRWTLQPLEAVLEGLENDRTVSLAPWLEKALDSDRVGFSSVHGPLPRVAQAEDVSVEPEWRHLAAQRLGSYPAWSRTWEAQP